MIRMLVILLVASAAHAVETPDAGVSCVAVERERDTARAEVRSLDKRLQKLDGERRSLADDLATTTAKLGDSQTATQTCQTAKDAICSGANELAKGVVAGKVTTSVNGCVDPAAHSGLGVVVDGWRDTQALLQQLVSFASGETDALPRLPSLVGSTIDAQRLAARILGPVRGAPPLFYRRLLIEALNLVAPRAWRRLQSAGPQALDGWFASAAPLDRALLDEAQGNHAGPALSSALELVRAYQSLVGCAARPTANRGCVRARALAELLESSGPLLVRRRVTEVWGADCPTLGSATTASWLADLPASAEGRRAEWREITDAVFAKLYSCYLSDARSDGSFADWAAPRLEGGNRADLVRVQLTSVSMDNCAGALHALEILPTPSSCELPSRTADALSTWIADVAFKDESHASLPLRACMNAVRLSWEGRAASIPSSFGHPPSLSELVVTPPGAAQPAVSRLRVACDARLGNRLPDELRTLSRIGEALGDPAGASPWRVDPVTREPRELLGYRAARGWRAWLSHVAGRSTTCDVLGLDEDRCRRCASDRTGWDCNLMQKLDERWAWRSRRVLALCGAAAALLFLLVWGLRITVAARRVLPWVRALTRALEGLGVGVRAERLRWIFPSRFDRLGIDLPLGPTWERWGRRAVLVGASRSEVVNERDVHRAAVAAQAARAELALLVHDESATLDLGAVRALLEWAARPGTRAVHVLPVSSERLNWARSPEDLLDLVEESSLRGNPFEVRGRITSSSQFWNRERLISGLLAGVEAGRWVVVTGLRRFGKSSLALEVSRRLPGPSGYVDLAGFHQEMALDGNSGKGADAILRFVCVELHASARERYAARGDLVGRALPSVPAEGATIDAAALAEWIRAFTAGCTLLHGRAPAFLIVLDELEQALGGGVDQLGHALDVLATVLGRLRNALQTPGEGPRVGLLVCSALHPVLWAPLSTLAHQSLMGALESVWVPCLPNDAARAMMRGLGARQGIRFTDAALDLIVGEAQGVPLLVRRLGSSVLELYDPERARQGALGAVEIGAEGAAAAVLKEVEEGSPARVWVESEIAEGTAGALLRRLAKAERVDAAELRKQAKTEVLAEFERSGIALHLTPAEADRRAAEAASVFVRALGDTGLLEAEGDMTSPEAYRLGPGLIRKILGDGS